MRWLVLSWPLVPWSEVDVFAGWGEDSFVGEHEEMDGIVLVEQGQELEDELTGEEIELSMNSFQGRLWGNTNKLIDQIKGRNVLNLIDSGGTHSFIDVKTSQDLKLETEQIALIHVAVVDGRQLGVCLKCQNCNWYI